LRQFQGVLRRDHTDSCQTSACLGKCLFFLDLAFVFWRYFWTPKVRSNHFWVAFGCKMTSATLRHTQSSAIATLTQKHLHITAIDDCGKDSFAPSITRCETCFTRSNNEKLPNVG
jgi:hypothetical protein